ncbi:MAG: hypothetical protein IPO63_01035 [Bacteroidetes bacterium]|nr:hypothetical protein [Bacteroidota bacterium]
MKRNVVLIFCFVLLSIPIKLYSSSFVVSNTAGIGPGSLRQSIVDANASPGIDTILFSLPGAGSWNITLSSTLPTIIDTVWIDGLSQPGSSYPNNLIKVTCTFKSDCLKYYNFGNHLAWTSF